MVSSVCYEEHMFQDPALLLRAMAKDTAAQGPDMVCYFILMAYNQRTFFPPYYNCTALRGVLMCNSSKGFY